MGLIRWAGWMGPGVVSDCLLEACPDGHTWQWAWGCSMTDPTLWKTRPKRYFLFKDPSLAELLGEHSFSHLNDWWRGLGAFPSMEAATYCLDGCFQFRELFGQSVCTPRVLLLGALLSKPLLEQSACAIWPRTVCYIFVAICIKHLNFCQKNPNISQIFIFSYYIFPHITRIFIYSLFFSVTHFSFYSLISPFKNVFCFLKTVIEIF